MRESPCPIREQQRRDIASAVAAFHKQGTPPSNEINEIIERLKRKEAASGRA